MRAQYDEDLESNPFFLSFKIQQIMLFENAIKKNWIITIPCSGSFIKEKYEDFDFLNHILVPIFEDNSTTNIVAYKTLGNQKVQIRDFTMKVYSKELEVSKEVQILFDETFYSVNDKAYKVMCISEPLNSEFSKIEPKNENGKVLALNSVEDSKSFLWKIMARKNTKIKVDELISSIKSDLQKIESPTVSDCFSMMKELYVSSYQIVTSHKTYIKIVKKNESLKTSVKLALEMYLCSSVFNSLFSALTDATSEKDEEINKATRTFQGIQASKSGIRFDMCENIPKARKELSAIRKISTPLEICECIRKVIAELSSFRKPKLISTEESMKNSMTDEQMKKTISKSQSGLMVNSDDLLSALIFLVIKSENANWYAYLEYAINFRFASCSRDDEYQYYLTTLEATLEHIRNMGTNTVEEDLVMDVSSTLSSMSGDSSLSNWTDVLQNPISSGRIGAVAYELNQVRQLFKLIESGQTSAVKELIQRSFRIDYASMSSRRTVGPSQFQSNQNGEHYCHPLCDCKLIIVDRKSCQSLVERSIKSIDIQVLPGSKTFDTAETVQKKYSIDNRNTQQPIFSISSVDDKGWNALHKAAYCGQLEIINSLLEFQFLIDSVTLEGETALHLAARRGHQDIVFRLIDSGADLCIQNYAGQTALHISVEYDHYPCISTLVFFGTFQSAMNINCINNSGNTPLHIAAMWGYESIVKCLLDNGASTTIKNNKGLRPVELASTRKIAQLIKIKAHQQELTLISKDIPIISKILLPNRNTNDKTSSISNPTKQKLQQNKKTKKAMEQMPKDLLKSNQPYITSDSVDRKIEKLLKVVADGDLQMLRFLLEIPEEEIETPEPIDILQELCHPLCQCSKCHPIQELIIKSSKQQLNINSTNKEGFHCLHIAAIHDRSTIAKFLLRHGADPNRKTHKLELTPMHLAAIYSSIKVLNVLLDHKGLNPNCVDKKLNTPLSYACSKDNVEVVEFLIKAGVTIDTGNYRGNTPLHEAVRHNKADIVNLLIHHGANLNRLNCKGLSPLDLSKDLSIYFILKNALQMKETKKSNESELDLAESGMVSLNSSYHTDHNLFNIDTDVLSLCSDVSLPSSEDKDCNENSSDRLFPEENKIDFNSQLLLDKCDSPIPDFDTSLLERIDKNSKYNYRLIFKDPNSPSLSSTNSSK